jgi:hypothetical protein
MENYKTPERTVSLDLAIKRLTDEQKVTSPVFIEYGVPRSNQHYMSRRVTVVTQVHVYYGDLVLAEIENGIVPDSMLEMLIKKNVQFDNCEIITISHWPE